MKRYIFSLTVLSILVLHTPATTLDIYVLFLLIGGLTIGMYVAWDTDIKGVIKPMAITMLGMVIIGALLAPIFLIQAWLVLGLTTWLSATISMEIVESERNNEVM